MSAEVRIQGTTQGQGTRLWVNGQEVRGMAAIDYHVEPGKSIVVVTFVAPGVELEGEVGEVAERTVDPPPPPADGYQPEADT